MFETASAPDGAASSGAVAFRECWSSAACNQKAQTSWFRQVAHLPSNKAILSETSMAVSKLTVDSAEWADIVRAMKAKAIAATVFIVPYFLLLSCLTRMQIAQLKCHFNILFKIYVKKTNYHEFVNNGTVVRSGRVGWTPSITRVRADNWLCCSRPQIGMQR